MNKITKIIYLIGSPFNQRDYERYGVETFIQNGFDVFVWDFTPFLHPQVDRLVIPPDPIEYKNFMRFNSKNVNIVIFFVVLPEKTILIGNLVQHLQECTLI